MDWNIPPILRKLLIDVDFQTGGKTIFSGSTIVGFVGLFNGMQSGPDGWSVSLDARGKGGKLLPNIVQGLLHKSSTPTQHIRKSLETSCNYTEAVNRIGATDLIDEAYFVMAGADLWSGGVVARNRNNVADYWPLNQSEPDGWFRLETSKMMHVCSATLMYGVLQIMTEPSRCQWQMTEGVCRPVWMALICGAAGLLLWLI